MTLQDHKDNIGKNGWMNFDAFLFCVAIIDVKQAYGKFRYLVAPCSTVNTSQPSWVSADRIHDIE